MAIEQKRYDEHPVPEAWINPDSLPYACPSSTVAVMVTAGSLNAGQIAALNQGCMSVILTDLDGNSFTTSLPVGVPLYGRWTLVDAGTVDPVGTGDVVIGYRT